MLLSKLIENTELWPFTKVKQYDAVKCICLAKEPKAIKKKVIAMATINNDADALHDITAPAK